MKVYLVIGQDGRTLEPVAVFANKKDAQMCADNHKTDENDYWVEELNYHE